MAFRNLFLSSEHKKLQESLKVLYTAVNSQDDTKPALEGVINAYTQKGADSLAGLPTHNDTDKAVLDMVKETINARRILREGNSSSNEREFLSSFDTVLSYRKHDVPRTVFRVSNSLARDISDADNSPRPSTLMQTKALDRLSQAYLKYSYDCGGPNLDGGQAGYYSFDAAMSTAFKAARGYKAHNHMQDSQRLYGQILHEMGTNAMSLKPDALLEAQNGAPAKASATCQP